MTATLHLTAKDLGHAVKLTLRRPKDGARHILDQAIPSPVLWPCLVAVVAVSVILGQGTLLLLAGEEALRNPLLANPLAMCVVQLGLLTIMVYAIHQIGKAFGGGGSFDEALALVVWLQFILACVQIVQTAAMFVMPLLADMLGVLGLVLFLWLLAQFIAEMHGFRSLGAIFAMIVISVVAVTFIFSLLLSMLGIVAPGAPNV